MWKRVNQLEYLFFGVTLTLMLDGFYPILLFYQDRVHDVDAGDNDPIRVAYTFFIYLVSISSFVFRPKSRPILLAVPAMLALLLVAVDSSFWSADPALSLRRVFAFLGTIAFAHHLMTRMTFFQFVQLIATVIRVIIIASVVLHAIDPLAATMDALDDPDHVGGWRGVTSNKNSLGAIGSIGFLLYYYMAVHAKKAPVWNGVWAGICLLMIYLAGSATSLAVALLALSLEFVVTFLARRAPNFYFLGIALTILAGILIVDLSWTFLLETLARDATLTGRTNIWELTIAAAEKRPWLGYGYGAFWDPYSNPECLRIWIQIDWAFSHAHNGWIETWLELGFLGVGVLAFYIGQAIYRCLIFVRENRLAHARLMFLLAAVIMLGNLTETGLINYFGPEFVIFLCVAITVARYAALRRARDPQRSAMTGRSDTRPRAIASFARAESVEQRPEM
jgi:exopolysaccharide production protein ExoQ